VDEYRTLEVQRLDALKAGLWERATSGDVKAVLAVLRVVQQRSRLLGLDKPESETHASATVVDPAHWVAAKERKAGRPEAHA
jgi:hypothetical protein